MKHYKYIPETKTLGTALFLADHSKINQNKYLKTLLFHVKHNKLFPESKILRACTVSRETPCDQVFKI